MDPLESELRVVAAAEKLAATLGSDSNHTVAAAAMDTAGRVYTAVNVYHFTGGPCAELVVLGVAAAAQAGPLLTIAAAGDGGRGLIPPCGRCRQVLLDLHPDIVVAVPRESQGDSPEATAPQVQPIRKLLPGAYFHPDSNARRVVRFNKRYYDSVADGTKISTIRYDDPVPLGKALFVFEDDEHNRTLDGEVTAIERYRLDLMTAEQARLGQGATLADLRAGLRGHYPDMPDDANVDVVTFSVQLLGGISLRCPGRSRTTKPGPAALHRGVMSAVRSAGCGCCDASQRRPGFGHCSRPRLGRRRLRGGSCGCLPGRGRRPCLLRRGRRQSAIPPRAERHVA
jgi:cytidine deaminase